MTTARSSLSLLSSSSSSRRKKKKALHSSKSLAGLFANKLLLLYPVQHARSECSSRVRKGGQQASSVEEER